MLAVFGKLPARRDFIAREVPNKVLEAMEPWLQQSMAQSRQALGERWMPLYLRAPLWRFWWSSRLAGHGVVGAMMPSVDKMGRYFPLLAFSVAPPSFDFALPSLADDKWYQDVETALLGALSQDAPLEDLYGALDGIGRPPRAAAPSRPIDGSLWWSIGRDGGPAQRAAWPMLPPHTAFADMLHEGQGAQGEAPGP